VKANDAWYPCENISFTNTLLQLILCIWWMDQCVEASRKRKGVVGGAPVVDGGEIEQRIRSKPVCNVWLSPELTEPTFAEWAVDALKKKPHKLIEEINSTLSSLSPLLNPSDFKTEAERLDLCRRALAHSNKRANKSQEEVVGHQTD